ncbi:MAG: HAD hydrolase family protein [Gemmatimonadota bacterium]|jgi:3-deoxy-D-manno-octulosonate 8-phosphate phosphatase (KDO 8-P phosphatase)
MTHARRTLSESVVHAAHTIPGEVARRIRLAVFDVDGVLTDTGVYLGATAEGETVELKRFDIQDGLGLKLLEAAGIGVVLISGRVSPATVVRADELGLEMYQDGGARKMVHLSSVMRREGLEWHQVAMLADDLPDLAVLRRVGLKAAVANAQPEVLDIADWTARSRGGHGAAREFCRALLEARGEWETLVEDYVSQREHET